VTYRFEMAPAAVRRPRKLDRAAQTRVQPAIELLAEAGCTSPHELAKNVVARAARDHADLGVKGRRFNSCQPDRSGGRGGWRCRL